VPWLADRMKSGIPGGLVEESDVVASPRRQVRAADVINAGWLVDASAVDGTLQRTSVDAVMLKALDNIDVANLWCSSGGTVERQSAPKDDPVESGSVLSARAIRNRLAYQDPTKRMVITPLLGAPTGRPGSIGDAGIDVRLASSFFVFRHAATAVVDPYSGTGVPGDVQQRVEKDWGEPFILHPGELVLAATIEYVVLPMDLTGQLVTRSSWGRLGLITATAVQIQPGSSGVITLELVNVSRTPIALRAGQRIGQLILYHVSQASPEPQSRTYVRPTGPEQSKLYADWDIEILRRISASSADLG
jgi:deoxycytidine triphosphate deaminase